MEEKKIATLFTNNNGKYYIEQVQLVDGKEYKENNYEIIKTIDETEDWNNFEETEKWLSNPTIEDGQTFCVINWLQE